MRIPSERGRVAALAALGLCSLLVVGPLAAQEDAEAPLSLWTSNAPIASVLEQVVGSDVFDVRVGDGVEGLVSGRLEGSISDVLERLLDRYELSVHNDGSTVWFDRRDREVVELVELDPELEPALVEWATREFGQDAPGRKGTVSHEGAALRVSGSRSFVQSSLARLDAARDALNGADAQAAAAFLSEAKADAAVDTGTAIEDDSAARSPSEGESPSEDDSEAVAAMSVWREPPETLEMPDADTPAGDEELARGGPPFRSVTDIPGFYTEYR